MTRLVRRGEQFMNTKIVDGALELSVGFFVPYAHRYAADAPTTWDPTRTPFVVPSAGNENESEHVEEEQQVAEGEEPYLESGLRASFGENRKGEAVLTGRREIRETHGEDGPELTIYYRRLPYQRRLSILVD